MPNLEPRYTPSDGKLTEAWLFGLVDALEFLQIGYEVNGKGATPHWFEVVASQLSGDIVRESAKYWSKEFEQTNGNGAVPVSEGRSAGDSPEEESIASRSARAGQDTRSLRRIRRARSVQQRRLARSIDSHPAGKRQDSVDRYDREVSVTELPTDGCGGSGHWFINEEGHLIGVCSCLVQYSSNNRSS